MIVTVTVNPSVDRTLSLSSPLERGSVTRAHTSRIEPGGKGVNVSRAAHAAGYDTCAVLPAPVDDPILHELRAADLPHRALPTDTSVRSNVTVTEPDGTTTKLNVAGAEMDPATADALADVVFDAASNASWITLCGSLPPGLSSEWYADVAEHLSALPVRVAIDTSGAPLIALRGHLDAVDIIKPNTEELAELSGHDISELDTAAAAGDFTPILLAARAVVGDTNCSLLATAGAAGALLVTPTGAWQASPPPIVPVSTVGAGDCALAGYLIASIDGSPPARALATAVAYGAAATSLAGTQPPHPSDVAIDDVVVTTYSAIAT